MTADANEVVRIASGPLVQIEVWQQALADAGIDGRVVGDDLTSSLGPALQNTIELWVHRGDANRAGDVIREVEARRGDPSDIA